MRRFNLIGVVILLMAVTAYGQNDNLNISEPEYIGNVLYVDGAQGQALEKQKASTKTKAGASKYIVGAGKVSATNLVEGIESPFRISKKDSLQFIIRVADNNIDPFQLINIFKLEQNVKKEYRFIEVGSASTFKGGSSMSIDFIPFDSKKYRKSSYMIQLNKGLIPGEYAITLEGSRDLFHLFGVD